MKANTKNFWGIAFFVVCAVVLTCGNSWAATTNSEATILNGEWQLWFEPYGIPAYMELVPTGASGGFFGYVGWYCACVGSYTFNRVTRVIEFRGVLETIQGELPFTFGGTVADSNTMSGQYVDILYGGVFSWNASR